MTTRNLMLGVAFFTAVILGASVKADEYAPITIAPPAKRADVRHDNAAVAKVKLNLSSVSSAADRKAPSVATTVWAMSSSFSHTTVVPARTVIVSGLKTKLSIDR